MAGHGYGLLGVIRAFGFKDIEMGVLLSNGQVFKEVVNVS